MKRTQSKAVKPARKGAVKVPIPEGFYRLPDNVPTTATDLFFSHLYGWTPKLWDNYPPPYGFYIRRNPRAARAARREGEKP